jgi:predicted transcriptional regulator
MVQLDEQEVEQVVTFLKVLADRSRFRLLALLSEREYTVKELAQVLDLKEPTVSAHLSMLKAHQMVQVRPEGTSRYYSLRQDDLFGLLRSLQERMPKEATEETHPDPFERETLNLFFERGKLKDIPVNEKKRVVVLQRLAAAFEPERAYSEKEVNEVLKRFYDDFATLRRYLIDYGLMTREKGVYRRMRDEG